MNKKNSKTNFKKYIVLVIILITIIGYAIYSVFKLAINPTDTFIVENGTLVDEQTLQGYIIRDEEILKGENYKNGLAQIKSEGEKVAKDEAIFRYYTADEENLIQHIKELDLKIQEAWESEDNIFSSDIKMIEQQIDSKLTELYRINDLQKIKEYKKDLNSYITKKAKIAGELSPAGSYLKKLIEERTEYENQLNSGAEYLKATKSGVVSYRVDGLEEVLNPADFTSLNKETLEKLNLKTGQIVSTSNECGKIIDNFYCYIATIIDNEKIEENNIEVGKKLTLRLSNEKEINAEIMYMTKEDEKETLVVFKVDKYVEYLISYRKISFDIIWWNVTGLKVPNDVIKNDEDQLEYVVRKRIGYTDKIYIKILKKGDKYSIIENYDDIQELLDKGINEDELKNRKKISLYDEIQL